MADTSNQQGGGSSSLQLVVTNVQNIVMSINAAVQSFGKTLNNIKPNVLIGNPTSEDGVLQPITLDSTLQFSGTDIGVNAANIAPTLQPLIGVQIGMICLWYSSAGSIPTGYGICNGSVYTRSDGAGTITSPNLVGLFVLGASAPGATGGSTTIAKANLPNYNLTVTDPGHNHTLSDPGHNHTLSDPGHHHTVGNWSNTGGGNPTLLNQGEITNTPTATSTATTGISIAGNTTGITIAPDTTGISVALGGSGAAFLPPYYELIYIMKY